MPALWLAQYLCPKRHALLAIAYDREQSTPAEAEEQLLVATSGVVLNPWCGLCGSRELHIEHGKLPTDDWDVAMVLLKTVEAANLASRQVLGEQNRN